MKKIRHGLSCKTARLTIKYILMTKLTLIFVFGFTIPSFANSYGQNISLNLNNVPVKEVLKAIEDQGFYRFVYKTRILPRDQKITINVDNASLGDVLSTLLQNSSLTWRRVN